MRDKIPQIQLLKVYDNDDSKKKFNVVLFICIELDSFRVSRKKYYLLK